MKSRPDRLRPVLVAFVMAAGAARPVPAQPTAAPPRGPVLVQGSCFPLPDDYLSAARRAQAEGRSGLLAWVDADGRVGELVVMRRSGDTAEHRVLDDMAVATFRRCRFEPLRRDGQPIPAWTRLEIVWRLDDEQPNAALAGERAAQARRTADRAAEGDLPSMLQLAAPHASTLSTAEERRKAAVWLRRAAEQGHALSQARWGEALLRGIGVPADANEGLRWLRRAAEAGEASAQSALAAEMLVRREDPPQAVALARKAASTGDLRGLRMLALAWETGWGGVSDLARAQETYREAANGGDAFSQAKLAAMLFDGRGSAPDLLEGARWLRSAAEGDVLRAQARLGLLYADGLGGVGRDPVRAGAWLGLAADWGDAPAAERMAGAYGQGQGVPRLPDLACHYASLAVRLGRTSAQPVEAQWCTPLDPAVRAGVQARVAAWRPGHSPLGDLPAGAVSPPAAVPPDAAGPPPAASK